MFKGRGRKFVSALFRFRWKKRLLKKNRRGFLEKLEMRDCPGAALPVSFATLLDVLQAKEVPSAEKSFARSGSSSPFANPQFPSPKSSSLFDPNFDPRWRDSSSSLAMSQAAANLGSTQTVDFGSGSHSPESLGVTQQSVGLDSSNIANDLSLDQALSISLNSWDSAEGEAPISESHASGVDASAGHAGGDGGGGGGGSSGGLANELNPTARDAQSTSDSHNENASNGGGGGGGGGGNSSNASTDDQQATTTPATQANSDKANSDKAIDSTTTDTSIKNDTKPTTTNTTQPTKTEFQSVRAVHVPEGDSQFLYVQGNVTLADNASASSITSIQVLDSSNGKVLTEVPFSYSDSNGHFDLRLPSQQDNAKLRLLDSSGGIVAEASSVTAAINPVDSDGDGASDILERSAAGAQDRNNDGTSDYLQASVTNLLSTQDGDAQWITLDAKGNRISHAKIIPSTNESSSKRSPYGMVDFKVGGLTPGASTSVDLLLPNGAGINQFLKWNPITHTSSDFAFDGVTGAEIHGDRVTIHYVDGGRGDADGLVNGEIWDPIDLTVNYVVNQPNLVTAGALTSGITFSQTGGTTTPGNYAIGAGPLANSVLITEGDSFQSYLAVPVTVSAQPSLLRFRYQASFDTTSSGKIKDAFEAGFVSTTGVNAGITLLPTYTNKRDSYFNLTETVGAAMSPGERFTQTTPGSDLAGTVDIDLRTLPVGTSGTLLLRLVNNDGDKTSNVRFFNALAVNTPPVANNDTYAATEDTQLVIAAAGVLANDTDAENNTLTAAVVSPPTKGSVSLAPNGGFTYTPNLNANGLDTFTYKANDGTDDSNVATVTINIAPVNDPPAGTDKTIAINEDAVYTFTAADFGFTDPIDSPANTLLAVVITTLPAGTDGVLKLSGVNVTANQSIPAASIPNLTFTPTLNLNGNSKGAFTFQVQDNGGTANGGIDLDPTPNTINFNIGTVNDPPAGTDKTIAINEDNVYTFAATDFGFTDPNDAPANTLLAVVISTLPAGTDGVLKLSGVNVTANQSIPVASIPSLTFTPTLNLNGNSKGAFTFQVQDNGGTAGGGIDLDPTPNTINFNIAPVNDPPAGTDKTIAINEDVIYTFTAADFGFTDPNDTPANTLLAVVISSLPAGTDGVLKLSGVNVTANQSIPVASIPSLTFTPTLNLTGNPKGAFTFKVQDNGGVANGGVDLDPTPNTINFNIGVVNDPPAGTDKTIAINEDAVYTFTAADFGFTDPNDTPANTLLAVVISSLPAGTDGVLKLSGVAVTANQSIPVASIPSLTFTPTLNLTGNPKGAFTFKVQDNGGTANGGIDLDPTPNTINFNITPVNDAPAGTDKTIAINEDVIYTFTAADFGFTDPNDTPANTLLAVVISSLPAGTDGVLKLSGVNVTANQSIPVASIPSLTFTPTLNLNGNPKGAFTFQVQDNGGTANGGIDLDPTPNTINFNIAPVNDPSAGTDKTIAINEDAIYTFTAADFGFTDPNDTPANTLLAVVISALPSGTDGVLKLSGVNVTANQSIPVASIPNLTFTPTLNLVGNPKGAFTFQVQDNGGVANGGIDLDPTPNTINFNIGSVNDAPAGTDKTIAINEDIVYTFAAGDFGFTDPNDTPANTLLAVVISSLPAGTDGVLKLSGVAVTANQSIPVASIPNLTFTPTLNLNGNPKGAFTFKVQDNGGVANGGVDLDPTPNNINFNISPVNDPPAGTDKTIAMLEDGVYTFTAADFGFTDPIDTPANTLLAVVISTLPAGTDGVLKLSGVNVTANQSIPVASIPNLTFTPVANLNGNPKGAFTFQVQDNGGVANGGTDLDASPNAINFNITPVNDAPAGTDKLIAVSKNTVYTFTAADFGFTDPIDSPANTLLAVVIATLPVGTDGVLKLSGVNVTANQSIPVASIPNLTFTPVTNVVGNPKGAFTFKVQDNGGTANGGIDLDPTPNTITFNITPVNSAPAGTDKTITMLEDGVYTFAAADFGFTDPNDTPANTLLAVVISTLPVATDGVLKLSGVNVTANQSIPAASIPNLTFTPVANLNGTPKGAFTFQVQDNGGTLNGGVDLDPTPNTINFNITAVNDAPAGTDKTIAMNEDAVYTFTSADFGFTDPIDVPANTLLAVTIATLPAGTDGLLKLSGVNVTANQSIPVASIPNLTFTPVANLNGNPKGAFTFKVQDNGGVANAGIDLDPTPNTINFNIAPVNDAPAGTDKTIVMNEDAVYTFTAADFGFTDPIDVPANTLLAVTIATLPAGTDGLLKLSGVNVTANQSIPVASIPNLTFTPVANLNGTPKGAFTFKVQDNGGVANAGVDLDPTPNTINFNITPVNDAPAGTDKTIAINEDVVYTFTAADFGFTDPIDVPANTLLAVVISTLPVATDGVLKLSGVNVTANQSIAAASIPNLTFTPTLNLNGNPKGAFTFKVQDNGGVANGGIDLDPTPNTINFNITPLNDAPAGTDKTIVMLEDGVYTFTAADFGFTDPNDTPPIRFWQSPSPPCPPVPMGC